MNVRFGDGYVEKTEGFKKLITLPNGERVLKLHLFKQADGTTKNIIHTATQVYVTDMDNNNPTPIIQEGTGYKVAGFGHISCVNAFDEYYFTALGTDIYYWNPNMTYAKKLEGTYDAPEWQPEHEYRLGDIVKPTNSNYNGYIYKCINVRDDGDEDINSGESDDTEPTWVADTVTTISETYLDWVGIASIEMEGSSGVQARAQFVELFKGFLFIANTTEDGTHYPYRVRWSQWQNPRLWHNNEDGSGLAGYVDVDDTEGRIIGIKRIGDALYIYKENSIIVFTYTGDADSVFSKEVVTTKAGLVSEDAIVELPHLNIFMSSNNIYAFDGNTCKPIGESISDWFFYKKLGRAGLNRVFGYYDEIHDEVVFCFNSGKDIGTGVVEPDVWGIYTTYKKDEIIRPTGASDYFYKCTQAGTRGQTEPVWPDNTTDEVTDGTVKWIGVTKEEGTYIPKDPSLETNNDLGLIYSLRYNNWSVREINATAIGYYKKMKDVRIDEVQMRINNQSNNVMIDGSVYATSQIFNVAGDKDGNLYIITGDDDERNYHTETIDGTEQLVSDGFHGYVISKTHSMEEPGKIKRLMRIQFHIETQGNYNMYCQVGSMWNPEGDDIPGNVTWTDKMYMNLQEPKPWQTHFIAPYIDLDISARYFRIKFGTEGNNEYFKILGYTLYYQVRGDE